jgi:hypothetical protein
VIGAPQPSEAAPYYFKYIDRVPSGDIVGQLEAQLGDTLALFSGVSEEKSLYRYAPEKWSIRQVVNHVVDTERVFLARAFWFARGFDTTLPSFDEKTCAQAARADELSWAGHIEDFRAVRMSGLTFFRNLPAEAWTRSGIASDNPFTVRALAYVIAGHTTHHTTILRERYLGG